VLALVFAATTTFAQTRLLRFPDLHGDTVVFTYAGDLWLAPATGGTARRLTAHPGLELFGKFSPDGRFVAFTGQYDGDEQVYVVPVEGGSPRQLTFYPAAGPLPPRWGYDNQVYDWSPDGREVLFRSMRDGWSLGDTRLHLVPVDGGMPRVLPMPESGGGALSPNGRQVAYSPVTRDFRHWKRYQGGWAQDLFILDLESLDLRQITDHPRTDRDPMWLGDTIYFASDRDDVLNLYAFDTRTGETSQITRSDVWDVRWPSADASTGRIVYESNGGLVVLDPQSGASQAIDIFVPTDLLDSRPRRVAVSDLIEGAGLSPKGERALFAARGDVFTAPIEHGPTRNLTRSSGAHDRAPAWSPDGEHVAFVSDRDGEQEVWLVDQEGRAEARQLTDGSTTQYSGLVWSPDSKRIAYRDSDAKLHVVEVASRQVVEVADDTVPFGLEYQWSPDGAWLALTLTEANELSSIFLWNVDERLVRRVTGELWNEFSPSFSRDGKLLFFLADREFRPLIGSFEYDYAVDRETYAYALSLTKDGPHPFPPRSDEVEVEGAKDDAAERTPAAGEKDAEKGDDKDDDENDEDAEKETPPSTRIVFDGLGERVTRVPIDADNYSGLAAVEGGLLLVRGTATYLGRQGGKPAVVHFDLKERKETVLHEGFGSVTASRDGKKLLLGEDGSYRLVEATPDGKDKPAKNVSLAGLQVDLDPPAEWAQIFDEVWRRFRDDFYAPNMHGYDWIALQERYQSLLRWVAHRSDLNYVLSEMIAELNVSHAYVAGGAWESPPRPRAGLLGARFELDTAANRYRFTSILPGHNEEPSYRSPLTEVGSGVEVGDYLLAVNGVELRGDDNPFRLLRHAGGAPVELLVSNAPSKEGARLLMVEPIDNEDDLLYLEWVLRNRQRVEERSGGRLGYLHIPDMGPGGLAEWIKWFYGQIRKEGMVIDVRSNGGGNISPMVIERLRRDVLMVDFERHREIPDTYPGVAFHGHLVCLIDEDTASDGDQFAYVFRAAGLGPLIGKRSWGGVVGIYGRGPLIDGGSVSVPEAGSADPQGNWVIEGHGVDPDIVVENHPRDLRQGIDAQLDRAIDELLAKLEREPKRLPSRPADPVKTPGGAR
jgi:tricorn protease